MAVDVPDEADPSPSPTPSSRDWRAVVRAIGRVSIATGLLLGGFVAYQLWGTAIEARRAQSALESEFEELLASTTTTSTTPTATMPSPTPTPATTPAPTTPLDTGPPDTAPADTVAPAPSLPPIEHGDPVAQLQIPAIGVDVVVVAGVSVDDLKRGPGHYPDTPLPGQFGNAAIAGHRTTYGQPFHDVDDLEAGDEIVVVTLAGRFVYEVTGIEIVEDDDTHVVATTDFTVAELTLTSCHPKWSARQRIIVHSLLDAAQSAPVGAPTVGYGGETPATTIPPATTQPTPTSTEPTTSEPTTSEPTSTESASTEPTASTSETTPPTTAAPVPVVTPAVTDAFSDGWFHDPSAIPQVLLWAAFVAAIALATHVFGRRIHSRWIGIAAGTLPFLIALYFFYQNVNRLLPPSL